MAPNQSNMLTELAPGPGSAGFQPTNPALRLLDAPATPAQTQSLDASSGQKGDVILLAAAATPQHPNEVAAPQGKAADSQGKAADSYVLLNRVIADASQQMDASHRSEFMTELDGFMTQAKLRNLSKEEIARTLDATAKLLEGQGQNPLSQTDRAWLATSMMHNLDHCDRVDQGFHNTCNVTAISKVLMSTDPATVAEMLSSTALNGYYKASDGRKIVIDAQSLQPDNEATGGETLDAKRNYATQLFDLIAINNYWQRQSPPFSYIQGHSTGAGDTGERLVNAFGQTVRAADGSCLDSPNLDCRAMIAVGKELGIKENFLVANTRADAAAGALVGSEQQLEQTLKGMLSEGHPAMIFVHSGNKLFTGKYGIGGGGWHVVTIDSYDPATGQFHLSNQWGANNDQMVSVADLYDATLPPALWAKSEGYFNKKIFDAYHQLMAGGGAGLESDQVLPSKAYDLWIQGQTKQMQELDLNNQLRVLVIKLDFARAANDKDEVARLEDWIRQTRAGLRGSH